MNTTELIRCCRTESVVGAIIAPLCYGIIAAFAGYPSGGGVQFFLMAGCMIAGAVQIITRVRMGVFPVSVAGKCIRVFFYASVFMAVFSSMLTVCLLPDLADSFLPAPLLVSYTGIWCSVVMVFSFWRVLAFLLLVSFSLPVLLFACLVWSDGWPFLLVFEGFLLFFMSFFILTSNKHIAGIIELRLQLEKQVKKLNLYKGNEGQVAKEAKNEFLANMSHELRTPMHSILSFARLGLKRKDSLTPEKQAFYFNMIMTSGQQLLELLNDLLELSTAESKYVKYQYEWFDLGDDIAKIVLEFQGLMEEKGIRFVYSQAEAKVQARYDRTKIRQVMRNLLSNALKFTDSGKKVSLQVEKGMLDQRHGGKKAWKISIIDEGIGIAEGELERVFEKFMQGSKTRTGAGGKGLGLAICKQIIEDHGGEIWAETTGTEKSGAVLSFLLPIGEKEESA
jgi:signal transduction histidine kinase